VIRVGMGNQNAQDLSVCDRLNNGRSMGSLDGPWIDNQGGVSRPEHISVGAGSGEQSRVGSEQPFYLHSASMGLGAG
jgi:hypothetical protein